MDITDIDNIREYSEFACSLHGIDFENLSLSDKVKTCIEKNIFTLYSNNPFFTEKLDEVIFEIDNENDWLIHSFSFGNYYVSTCGNLRTIPSDKYQNEIIELFFDSFQNENSQILESLRIDLHYEDLAGKQNLIKDKIKELRQSNFNNIFWEFNYNSKSFELSKPEGITKFLQDCQGFQKSLLLNDTYYPLLDNSDSIMAYAEEIEMFFTMDWLNYLYQVNEMGANNEKGTDSKESDTSTFEKLYLMGQLGMLVAFEDEEKYTEKNKLTFLSMIIGRNTRNIRKYLKELEKSQKDMSKNRITLMSKMDKIIKEG